MRLCRARDLLHESLDRGVSINEAAAEAALSPYHFIRRYKAVFGETPHQALITARLDKAKRLLITTDMPVTQVCMALGFASLGTFSHAFARRVGVPPSDYRRRLRRLVQVPGDLMPRETPGCLTLMWDWPDEAQFWRSGPTRPPVQSGA